MMRRLILLVSAACCTAVPSLAYHGDRARAILLTQPAANYSTDFTQAAIPAGVVESRTSQAFDYNATGAIQTFAANVPRWPSYTQPHLPLMPLGIGAWIGRTNLWLNNSQSQTITVVNNQIYAAWFDSAGGTATVSCTGSVIGNATANGWKGGFIAANAVGTSAVCTVTGTVTFGQFNILYKPPPIPTTTASVAVNSDVPTVPLSALNGGLNLSEGTIVALFYPTAVGVNAGAVATFDDGTTQNAIRAGFGTNQTGAVNMQVAGATVAGASTSNLYTPSTITRIAISYSRWRTCVSLNNGSVGRVYNTAAAPPSGLTRLAFGTFGGASQLNGYVMRVSYIPRDYCQRLNQLFR